MNPVKSILATLLVSLFASVVVAQDKIVTKQEVIVKPDGSYTVIKYPVGQEVTVNLLPSATVAGGKGTARVVRSADGTKVYFDVSGLPATTASYYTYAVDPTGTPTLLGPLTVTNGVATAEFTTPMEQFMLVVSPAEGLTGVTASNVIFTSEVPAGYAVVPRQVTETPVTAVAGSTLLRYDVPLLGVPTFKGDAKTVRLNFSGMDLKDLDAKAHIHLHKGEATTIRMEFDEDIKKLPGKRFVLWSYSLDGQYTKLGQVYNARNRDEAVIDAKTMLSDFGLMLTVEDADVMVPTSSIYSVFRVVP